MTRAVFLPSPGDPYVLLNCLKYFPIWESEIDTLYIDINSDIEPGVISALSGFLNHPKIKVSFQPYVSGHGSSIRRMFDASNEDFILLIEDDSIIFKKGFCEQYFSLLESNTVDAIGSPRMSCSPLLAEIAKKKFSLDYSGYGDKGPNFWPCFFFASRSILSKTDLEFSNFGWKKGDDFLGVNLDEDICGDTFVKASMDLRVVGARILEISQYHSNNMDLVENRSQKRGIFDGKCRNIHLGSLSSGISSYLIDENGRKLKERVKYHLPPEPHQSPLDMQTEELERRCGWWLESFEVGKNAGFYVSGFSESYEYSINALMGKCGILNKNAIRWVDIYKSLM